MKTLYLVFFLFLLFLSCSHNKIEEIVGIVNEKNNIGDTSGLRKYFSDSVFMFAGEYPMDTHKVDYFVINPIVSKIYGGFVSIEKIIYVGGDSIKYISVENPGYLFENYPDTIRFLNTYYFNKNEIYKIRVDTLKNQPYCYQCLELEAEKKLLEFAIWFENVSLDDYYNVMELYINYAVGNYQNVESIIKYENIQKQYYYKWKKESNINQ